MKSVNVIATNRFGLGARPHELDDAGGDPRDWLTRQVRGQRPNPAVIAVLPTSADVFGVYREMQRQRRASRQMQPDAAATKGAFAATKAALAPLYLDQVAARYEVAVRSDTPFRERMVHFWTNHFAVSADKLQVAVLAATLENEAIRPNIAASFHDMLLAVESHPAMLLYLDNQASVGSRSRIAQRRAHRAAGDARKLDINENLAREILELHTLGVNGGFTQADVTAFARVLTGWSVGGGLGPMAGGEAGKFVFRDAVHEPGAQTVVGRRYAEDGVAQGRAVLRDLAAHPSTAKHIATKLVRHFVADEPPADAVQQVAKVFLDSAGHLPSVHGALVELDAAWQSTSVKYKTPHEFIVSTLRCLDRVPDRPRQLLASLQLLGQRPFTPGSPAGWPDTAAQWDAPDALLKRIEWATRMGERCGAGAQPLQLAVRVMGVSLGDRTRTAIARAASAAQGVTLLLASPEFLRR